MFSFKFCQFVQDYLNVYAAFNANDIADLLLVAEITRKNEKS